MRLRSSFYRSVRVRFVALIVVSFVLLISTLSILLEEVSAGELVNSSDVQTVEGTPATFIFIPAGSSDYRYGYATIDGTADGTGSSDYTAASGSLEFKCNQQRRCVAQVDVLTNDDTQDEVDETFTITVSTYDSKGNLVGVEGTWTATIRDNDLPAPAPSPVSPAPPAYTPPPPAATPPPPPVPDPVPEPTDLGEPQVLSDITPTETLILKPDGAETKRPELVRSISDPTEISTNPLFIAQNLLLALLLILLIAFPADMFNSTLLAHYEEITGWFGAGKWLDRHRQRLSKLPSALILASFACLSAAIYGFLSPDFGWNQTSFVLFAGMFVTMIVVSVIYDVFRSAYLRKRFGIQSRLRSQATGLVMASIMVFASRMANFLPGYLYGVFTALIFTKKPPTEKQDGEGLAVATIVLGIVALIGWFAWVPVKAIASGDDPSLVYLILDSALASLWVAGLGVIVFGLAPLKFFYGETVKAWSKWGWRVIYATGMLLFVHTVLHPSRGFYGKSDKTTLLAVLTLFIGFGLFSLMFWGYFRYRHLWRHMPDAPIELS